MDKSLKVFSREQFRSIKPACPEDRVPLPEFGADVVGVVRGLTGGGRDRFETALMAAPAAKGKPAKVMENIRARLVALTLYDDKGERVFGDSPEEAEIVAAWPASVVHRLFERAKELSGMSNAEVEELGKTYGAARSDT